MKKEKIPLKEIVRTVSDAAGKKLILPGDSAQMLGTRYMTVVCMEGPAYFTLQGTARIGKGCADISGDNFSMMDMSGGRRGAVLSDGMGSGEEACRESTLVIELLEELLAAGFPEKTAIQMINTTLVIGREEIHYSTVDMTVFDLYTGECEIIKAGASSTFIKKKGQRGTLKLHQPAYRSDEPYRDRFCKAEAGGRRFCDHGNGRSAGRSPGRRAGYPAGDDHTGERDL